MRAVQIMVLSALCGCVMGGAGIAWAEGAPAVATPAAKNDKGKHHDPNEVVCRTQDVLGSRLKRRRVCMTRSEWTEQQRIDRSLVERSQSMGCVSKSDC